MLLRTVVGAVSGTVAGLGYLMSTETYTTYCHGAPTRAGCRLGFSLTVWPLLAFWTVVAGLLVHAGFRAWRAERGWWVAGIGGGLWFAGFVAVLCFSVVRHDLVKQNLHLFLSTSYVVVPCIAYAFVALCTRRRT